MEVDDTSIDAEGATISWNEYTDLEQSDFNQYLIKLKKRNTEEDVETFKVRLCLYSIAFTGTYFLQEPR